MEANFKVIENSGGVHLFVFADGKCVYARARFQNKNKKALRQCIDALKHNPEAYAQWAGCVNNCAMAWEYIANDELAWSTGLLKIIYTQDGPIDQNKWGTDATDLLA